jgi:c-di-GMP-binding flagellar brake protein YcgR
MDYRHEQRYDVVGEAEVLVGTSGKGSSLVRGRILDLSTAGCYIQTLARVAVQRGAQVHVEFWVYGQFFRVRASSRFSLTKVGIGFNFIDMDQSTRERLNHVVMQIKAQAEADADSGVLQGRSRTA